MADTTFTAPDFPHVFATHMATVRFGGLQQEGGGCRQVGHAGYHWRNPRRIRYHTHARGVGGYCQGSGGKEESTLLGFGGRAPCFLEVFLHGAMTHCMDFDDHLPEGHHPSSAVIPGLLAVAERVGGVSGEEFITAVAQA